MFSEVHKKAPYPGIDVASVRVTIILCIKAEAFLYPIKYWEKIPMHQLWNKMQDMTYVFEGR